MMAGMEELRRAVSQLIPIAIQERRLVPPWWQALGIFANILASRRVGAGVPSLHKYSSKASSSFLIFVARMTGW